MGGVDNPYKKAQEIGFLGSNLEMGVSITNAIEELKYDYRELGKLHPGEEEATVYECQGAEPRFIAEITHGDFYTSVVFTEPPDEDDFKTAMTIEADRLDLL